MNLAHFELHVTAIDPGEPRKRWNGDPMASSEASAALLTAVDTFKASLGALGFQMTRAGYGVTGQSVAEGETDPRGCGLLDFDPNALATMIAEHGKNHSSHSILYGSHDVRCTWCGANGPELYERPCRI